MKIPNIPDLDTQPYELMSEANGICVRSVFIAKKGTTFNHKDIDKDQIIFVGSGKLRFWVDGTFKGDFCSGESFEVKQNQDILFQTLETNTRLACIYKK